MGVMVYVFCIAACVVIGLYVVSMGNRDPRPDPRDVILEMPKNIVLRMILWGIPLSLMTVGVIIGAMDGWNETWLQMALLTSISCVMLPLAVVTEQERLYILQDGLLERNVFYAPGKRRSRHLDWTDISRVRLPAQKQKGDFESMMFNGRLVFELQEGLATESKDHVLFDRDAFNDESWRQLKSILTEQGIPYQGF